MKTKLKLQFPQIKNVALKTACRLLICLLLAVFFSGCATTNTIKSVMTSDPPGADIYWGSSRNSLEYLEKTPMTRTYTGTNTCWSAWYYQFKKTGYDDSEIIFKEEGEELADRYVHGTLKALFRSVTYQNGETYTGEFKNDQRNGQGTYTWSDGQKYVGEFKYDKRNGQGTFTWPSGQKYVGEYLNDQYNGQGTLTLSDGREYVGEFKKGKKTGRGTFTWPSGRKYVGEWENNERNGFGTVTLPNGKKEAGEWKDGNLVNRMSGAELAVGIQQKKERQQQEKERRRMLAEAKERARRCANSLQKIEKANEKLEEISSRDNNEDLRERARDEYEDGDWVDFDRIIDLAKQDNQYEDKKEVKETMERVRAAEAYIRNNKCEEVALLPVYEEQRELLLSFIEKKHELEEDEADEIKEAAERAEEEYERQEANRSAQWNAQLFQDFKKDLAADNARIRRHLEDNNRMINQQLERSRRQREAMARQKEIIAQQRKQQAAARQREILAQQRKRQEVARQKEILAQQRKQQEAARQREIMAQQRKQQQSSYQKSQTKSKNTSGGDQSYYSYCDDWCDDMYVENKDSKEIAVKACRSGCTIVHWQFTALSGKVNCEKANRKLLEQCIESSGNGYSNYCYNAYKAWAKEAGCYK